MYRQLMNERLYNEISEGLEPEKAISYETYLNILDSLLRGQHAWPVPRRIEICKTFSQKRRIVYSYPKEEMFVLRAVNHYLCRRYRNSIAMSYFPSRQRTPSQCLTYILHKRRDYIRRISSKTDLYGMHLDISDYFNSMDVELLFERLPVELQNDSDFQSLYHATLGNPLCQIAGEEVEVERKGCMAGLPFTAFFAAAYLSGMDKYFEQEGIPYARYSDDILFFSESPEKISHYLEIIKEHITESRLLLNLSKTEQILPGKPWTFIGFEVSSVSSMVHNDEAMSSFGGNSYNIDISVHQEEKLKRRIGKWARRFRKRVEIGSGTNERKIGPEKAVKSLIRNVNRALFKPIQDQYCWAHWAFPTINDTKRIKAMDEFIQEKLRYVYTGRYCRSNFKVLPYEKLKQLGYNSLGKLYLLYRYRPEDFDKFMLEWVMVPAERTVRT